MLDVTMVFFKAGVRCALGACGNGEVRYNALDFFRLEMIVIPNYPEEEGALQIAVPSVDTDTTPQALERRMLSLRKRVDEIRLDDTFDGRPDEVIQLFDLLADYTTIFGPNDALLATFSMAFHSWNEFELALRVSKWQLHRGAETIGALQMIGSCMNDLGDNESAAAYFELASQLEKEQPSTVIAQDSLAVSPFQASASHRMSFDEIAKSIDDDLINNDFDRAFTKCFDLFTEEAPNAFEVVVRILNTLKSVQRVSQLYFRILIRAFDWKFSAVFIQSLLRFPPQKACLEFYDDLLFACETEERFHEMHQIMTHISPVIGRDSHLHLFFAECIYNTTRDPDQIIDHATIALDELKKKNRSEDTTLMRNAYYYLVQAYHYCKWDDEKTLHYLNEADELGLDDSTFHPIKCYLFHKNSGEAPYTSKPLRKEYERIMNRKNTSDEYFFDFVMEFVDAGLLDLALKTLEILEKKNHSQLCDSFKVLKCEVLLRSEEPCLETLASDLLQLISAMEQRGPVEKLGFDMSHRRSRSHDTDYYAEHSPLNREEPSLLYSCYTMLSRVYSRSFDFKKAETMIDLAIQLEPLQPSAYLLKAELSSVFDDNDQAAEQYSLLIRQTNSSDAYFYRSYTWTTGDREKCRRDLVSAIDADSTNIEAILDLAELETEAYDYTEASRLIEMAQAQMMNPLYRSDMRYHSDLYEELQGRISEISSSIPNF